MSRVILMCLCLTIFVGCSKDVRPGGTPDLSLLRYEEPREVPEYLTTKDIVEDLPATRAERNQYAEQLRILIEWVRTYFNLGDSDGSSR